MCETFLETLFKQRLLLNVSGHCVRRWDSFMRRGYKCFEFLGTVCLVMLFDLLSIICCCNVLLITFEFILWSNYPLGL